MSIRIHNLLSARAARLHTAIVGALLALSAGHASAQITATTLEGTTFMGRFGTGVASIGDVNQDNVPDFAVGRPEASTNGVGVVTIYSGANMTVLKTLTGITDAAFGTSVAGAGDVNKDGWPDIIVGSPDYNPLNLHSGRLDVFSGKDWSILYIFTGPESSAEFGRVVAGGGDFNNDGWDDFYVSAANGDGGGGTDRGMVRAYSGKDGAVLGTWWGPAAFAHFGASLASIGDMNGNGYDDIAVGAPDDDTSAFNGGYVAAIDGQFGGVIWTGIGFESGGRLGSAVAGADVNGDGLKDLVVGAVGEANNFGRVKVIPGPWGGVALWSADGAQADDAFGFSLANAGDVNKDGKEDVLVGAPQTFTGTGYARILSGANKSTLWSTIQGDEQFARFGRVIAPLGDLNQDGWLEVAIGAPDDDVNGNADAGSVRIVRAMVEQQNLGFGGPGSSTLRIYGGALSSGNSADLRLQFAPANNPAFLIVSGSTGYLPYKQGTIVPGLNQFVLIALTTSPSGEIFVPAIPGGFGGTFNVYTQFVIPSVSGIQFSNALKVQLLP